VNVNLGHNSCLVRRSAEEDKSIGAGLDLGAVFTHEAGHYVGLGHTPNTTECEAQTMYPSVKAGDDTKQSLGIGDENGIERLY
jgi:Matrixin